MKMKQKISIAYNGATVSDDPIYVYPYRVHGRWLLREQHGPCLTVGRAQDSSKHWFPLPHVGGGAARRSVGAVRRIAAN
jgi:hypothetical protein